MGRTEDVQEKEESINREEKNRTLCMSTPMLTLIRNGNKSNWK